MHPLFRAFRHRNYRLYWTGFALSLVGTWMQTLAMSWLVWRLTASPFWLGVVGAMPQLPSLLLGSIGGVLVDRTVKRRLLIITQAGLGLSALALAIVTLMHMVRVEHVVLIAAVSGLFTAVDTPARLSFVSEIVGKEYIGNAVALNSTTFNGARLIGPAIAGFLVPVMGEGGIFLVNAASFLAMIVALMLMRDLPAFEAANKGSVIAQWREAFHYVRITPVPRLLIFNVIIFAGFGFAYNVLLPVYADDVLKVGVRGLGTMMGAVGIGALAGGIWQATLPDTAKRGRVVIGGAFGLCLGLAIYSLSPVFEISIVGLTIIGVSGIAMLASTNTILQTTSPDHLRGRVLGFYTTAFMGILPIGSLLLGSLAAKLGTIPVQFGAAVLCLIAALATLLRTPHLRDI